MAVLAAGVRVGALVAVAGASLGVGLIGVGEGAVESPGSDVGAPVGPLAPPLKNAPVRSKPIPAAA